MLLHTTKPIPLKILSLAVLSVLFISGISMVPKVHALTHSSSVAYVFDFGTGVCDTSGPGSGSSVFVNAVMGTAPTGCPGAGPYTYVTGSNGFGTSASGTTVTFTNVPVSSITGVSSLSGFDTVLLYMVCDIGTQTTLMAALNAYLTAGDGKVIILDGDRCTTAFGGPGNADYSTFLFPFTSSNPGPSGFSGSVTSIETESPPAVLTRAITVGFIGSTDAIGDSNTFLTFNPAWCIAQAGTNGLGVTGGQLAYVPGSTTFRTSPLPAGSLVIWNGWDQWFTFGANAVDAQVFDNMLDQPFNPDSLPCNVVATGITLSPSSATNPVGTSHTVTATVLSVAGAPIVGVTVTFTVLTGPNAGKTGTGVTNAAGQATFTYSDTGGAGVDTIQASFTDANGLVHNSNIVDKTWGSTTGVPEFPFGSLAMIALLAPLLLLLRRRITPQTLQNR